MKLSENFGLYEFFESSTADRNNINNLEPANIVSNLERTVINICQPVREHFGVPVYITSGYRSQELNELVGGAENSQHTSGEAVDMKTPYASNIEIAKYIRDNLDFDQLILEAYDPENENSGWVHCSYKNPDENRKEVLTATFRDGDVNYSWGLNP